MERKTKIVATIADNRCEVNFLRDLYNAGMNVVRINSAHLTPQAASKIVRNVREVSDNIAILIDTKGPEIRTTKCENDGFEVKAGQTIKIKGGTEITTKEVIYVSYQNIVNVIEPGTVMLIDDGEMKMTVVDKDDEYLTARIENSGKIKNRKSVNIPNISLDMESVTERDEEFIRWAVEEDIDFIAHSFVRRKEDVIEVQRILDSLDSSIKIISKIENLEGVEKIEEILEHTYGIMVARGDLGVELPAEQIPYTQKSIVEKCIERKKPVIIATQILQSMITNPRATRAEISDIANAIFQRADAIMLSGETANGDYPVDAVETMNRVALEIEKHTEPIVDLKMVDVLNEVTAQLARSAVRSCISLPVRAVIVDTLSGRTARYMSAFRGQKPVYAICYKKSVMRELALSYGVFPSYQEPSYVHRKFLRNEMEKLAKYNKISDEDMVVVVGGDYGAEHGASFMEISRVDALMYRLKQVK